MKHHSLLFAILTIALLPSLSLQAQGLSNHYSATSIARSYSGDNAPVHYAGGGNWSSGAPLQPLSSAVSIPGADSLPISGHLQQPQTDGRALHNIQVDPSNPLYVHAVITELSSDWVHDTNLLSRRVYYTFSSDGGHTWKAPIVLSNVRSGFPCMILYNRGGKYVPIIAAHRFTLPLVHPDTINTPYECALWVEQGNPGDGNFAMTECGTNGVNGSADLLWPYIGISPAADTIYIVSSFSNPKDGFAADYIEFGTFSLDKTGKAAFNGWSQEIGTNNSNDAFAGYDQSGDYVLRVSPKGKVGLLWRETYYATVGATPSASLYFIESTDGGNTWPQDNFNPLETIADQSKTDPTNGKEIYTGPSPGLDFFYNGENAKILWEEDQEVFDNDTIFDYPTEVSLHLFDVASDSDFDFVSNVSGDSAQYSLLGSLAFYSHSPFDDEADLYINYPTIAQSSDPNTFAVFYQTFPVADTVFFTIDTVKLYGSIYYQLTKDGGKTWTEPTPFRFNTGPAGTFGKIDFRWPQVSDWNGASLAAFSPTVMYAADTAAGTTAKNGASDWDIINFFHDTLSLASSGVSNNAGTVSAIALENYPNPLASSTTIQFTLPSESNVLLSVTDMLGRPIATLVNGRMGAGMHTAVFNAGDLADGVYRYTLQADGVSVSGSMSLLR